MANPGRARFPKPRSGPPNPPLGIAVAVVGATVVVGSVIIAAADMVTAAGIAMLIWGVSYVTLKWGANKMDAKPKRAASSYYIQR